MRGGAVGLGVWLVLAAPVPAARADVDLRDVKPVGVAGSDAAELAAAGDVNGDGVQDVAVGLQDDLRTRDPASLSEIAVVGFGRTPPDPSRRGFAGLVVSHLAEPALADDRGRVNYGRAVGGDVVGVGDWNGDGLDDVAFGAMGAGPRGRPNAGSVYVVLGRREPATIDVRSGAGVVRIDGPARASRIGSVLGAAGDVDGDGRPDLAIALPGERAIVVRGGVAPGATIDLARPPAGATIELRGLDAGAPPPRSGRGPGRRHDAAAFAAAGDVDGDGRGDLMVGVPAANPLGRGRLFVVRGAPSGSVVDARDPRSLVAHVVAPPTRLGFGGSVAAMPDADGDGRPEWVIGTALRDDVLIVFGGSAPSGVLVVFSRARGEVRPGRAGEPVMTVQTGRRQDPRSAVAGIPDATGDGVPDLLVGLPDASPSCRGDAGTIALVPGQRTPGRVRMTARSPRVDGPYAGAELGGSIAVADGELFAGTRPFENAATLDLWRVPLTAPARPAPALPDPDECLSVTIVDRSLGALRRTGVLRVVLRSDAGDGRPHRVRVRIDAFERAGRSRRGAARVVAMRGAGRRRVTFVLAPRARELLARGTTVTVEVEQRVGSGVRATSGASAGDAITLRRP
jgi:FG-GAP-like repeat/FG-GAP repeat